MRLPPDPPAAAPGGDERRAETRRPPPRVILFATLLGAAALLFGLAWARGWIGPETIRSAAREAGPWAFAVYAAAVFVGEMLWMPRMWGLVAGGLLFGPLAGALLSLGADLAAAATAFFLARSAGREWVARLLRRRPRAERLVRLLAERRGALTIFVLRICPVAHYTLVSFAAGLAGVPLRPFLLGTAVGLLPGAALYPVLGDSIDRPSGPVFLAGMVVLAVFLVVTLRIARRLLREPAPAETDAVDGLTEPRRRP